MKILLKNVIFKKVNKFNLNNFLTKIPKILLPKKTMKCLYSDNDKQKFVLIAWPQN